MRRSQEIRNPDLLRAASTPLTSARFIALHPVRVNIGGGWRYIFCSTVEAAETHLDLIWPRGNRPAYVVETRNGAGWKRVEERRI